MSTLLQDLRYAARMLRKSPGFTAVAVLALALGIGATSAIYTAVDSVLLRPLPYREPERLTVIEAQIRGEDANASYPDWLDLRARNHTFTDVALYRRSAGSTLSGRAEPMQIDAIICTANLFDLLGVPPALGRGFVADEGVPGKSGVVVISAELAQRLGGGGDLLGRSLIIDDMPHTVVGITAPGFRFYTERGTNQLDAWMPYPQDDQDKADLGNRGSHSLQVLGRLKPGVTLARAQADLDAVAAQMRVDHPADDEDAHFSARVVSFRDNLVGKVRPALVVLLLAVLCVLLIACANVAGMLLSRATVRQREIAIRTALGASRGRIVRQMLTESALLGLIGCAAGILLGLWLVDLLGVLARDILPMVGPLALDAHVLGLTVLAALATSLGFGLVPALHAARTDLNDALKETARSTAHARSRRARNALLVGEIAVTLVLLVGAGLAMRSFARLTAVDPGFRHEDVVMGRIKLPQTRYRDDGPTVTYYRQLRERLRALPGVEAATLGAPMPFSNSSLGIGVHAPGQPSDPVLPAVRFHSVDPGYFDAFGIALKQGRLLAAGDDEANARPVAVINEKAASLLGRDGNPVLGRHLIVGYNDLDAEIVGVVANTRNRTLDEEQSSDLYMAFARAPLPFIAYAVRGPAPRSLIAASRAAVLSVDAELPASRVERLDDSIGRTLGQRRLTMVLLGLFALLALVLATIGIYGVMSYTVTQRTREIGIRMALGAGHNDVLRLVLGESLRLAAGAIVVGAALALALAKLAAGLFYGVSAHDPLTLLGVSLLLLAVCLLAGFLPARRAAQVDPMVALRYE